jgi:hypothetical protein
MTTELELKDRIDFLLQEWVNQNSHTENLPGIRNILDQVSDEADGMGLHKDWVPGANDDELPMLRVRTHHDPSRAAAVRLLAHADTPFDEHASLQLITFTAGRLWAIGPGVLGNKGGILLGLLALNRVRKQNSIPLDMELWVLPHAHQIADMLNSVSDSSPKLQIPLLPSPIDRQFSFTESAAASQKMVAKVIELHEKKKAVGSLVTGPATPTLFGLGPVGSGSGTNQESLEMASIFSRADIIMDILVNWVF